MATYDQKTGKLYDPREEAETIQKENGAGLIALLNSLDEEICSLNKTIVLLQERLTPVLQPAHDKNESDGLERARPTMSPLSTNVSFLIEQVREMHDRVGILTARVEI